MREITDHVAEQFKSFAAKAENNEVTMEEMRQVMTLMQDDLKNLWQLVTS